MKCPCCGQEVPKADLVLTETHAYSPAGVVRMSPQEMLFLKELHKTWGATVAYHHLVGMLFDPNAPGFDYDKAKKQIMSVAYDVRKRIAVLGWTVRNKQTFGYRLEKTRRAKASNRTAERQEDVHS